MTTTPPSPTSFLWPTLAKAGLLLALGGYFVGLYATGKLVNYISPQWAWLALLAGGLFVLLGLVQASTLLPARPAAPASADHDHAAHDHDHAAHAHDHAHDHGDHQHATVAWPVLALLAVPLLLGVLVPSRPLGAGAMAASPSVAGLVQGRKAVALEHTTTWTLLDWEQAYSAAPPPYSEYNGQPADVVGFVYRPPDLPSEHIVLARFVMIHCAADARGIGMLVRGPAVDALPLDTWVHVQGTMEVAEFQGELALVLNAQSVDDKIGDPDQPYLFPH